MLNIEQLKTWMKENGISRDWLANEIGAKKRSLDNYFTAGEFPEWAEKHIHRIMTTLPALRFTDAEFDRLERARAAAGYLDRTQFYIDAINIYADKIIADAETKVTPIPQPLPRVAEDETPYGKPAKAGPKGKQPA